MSNAKWQMKTLTAILKIIAVVLNVSLLTFVLVTVANYGFRDVRPWHVAAYAVLFTSPPVTVITIVFTVVERLKTLTSFLKILTIILNALLLCLYVAYTATIKSVGIMQLIVALAAALSIPLVSLSAVALTLQTRQSTEHEPSFGAN